MKRLTNRWLERKRNRALAVLASSTDPHVRSVARVRLNAMPEQRAKLKMPPLMKRGLEIDKVPRQYRRRDDGQG